MLELFPSAFISENAVFGFWLKEEKRLKIQSENAVTCCGIAVLGNYG